MTNKLLNLAFCDEQEINERLQNNAQQPNEIVEISFHGSYLGSLTSILKTVLMTYPEIKSLNLRNTQCEIDNLIILLKTIATSNGPINHIDLGFNELSSINLLALADEIGKSRKITLDITGNLIDDQVLSVLQNTFPNITVITDHFDEIKINALPAVRKMQAMHKTQLQVLNKRLKKSESVRDSELEGNMQAASELQCKYELLTSQYKKLKELHRTEASDKNSNQEALEKTNQQHKKEIDELLARENSVKKSSLSLGNKLTTAERMNQELSQQLQNAAKELQEKTQQLQQMMVAQNELRQQLETAKTVVGPIAVEVVEKKPEPVTLVASSAKEKLIEQKAVLVQTPGISTPSKPHPSEIVAAPTNPVEPIKEKPTAQQLYDEAKTALADKKHIQAFKLLLEAYETAPAKKSFSLFGSNALIKENVVPQITQTFEVIFNECNDADKYDDLFACVNLSENHKLNLLVSLLKSPLSVKRKYESYLLLAHSQAVKKLLDGGMIDDDFNLFTEKSMLAIGRLYIKNSDNLDDHATIKEFGKTDLCKSMLKASLNELIKRNEELNKKIPKLPPAFKMDQFGSSIVLPLSKVPDEPKLPETPVTPEPEQPQEADNSTNTSGLLKELQNKKQKLTSVSERKLDPREPSEDENIIDSMKRVMEERRAAMEGAKNRHKNPNNNVEDDDDPDWAVKPR